MFMAAMAMVPPWKIVEDFQNFVKNTKLWPSLQTSVSCKNMGSKSSHWSCLKACFNDYTFCFTTFLVRPSTRAQQSHDRAPKYVQMTLKDISFVNKFKVLFVCIPEDVRPSNFEKCLKMPQRVTLVPKTIFCLKILNFVQSYVGFKVSLADGNSVYHFRRLIQITLKLLFECLWQNCSIW